MNSGVCPLCRLYQSSSASSETLAPASEDYAPGHDKQRLFHLKDIVYKHLQIKIKEKYLGNVCKECEKTIDDWDKFAQKCWSNQTLLNDESKDGNIKLEDYVEVKVEKFNDDFDENDDDDDDKPLITHYDAKNDDPLFDFKKEDAKLHDSKTKKSSKKIKIKKNSKKSESKRHKKEEHVSGDNSLDDDFLIDIKTEDENLSDDRFIDNEEDDGVVKKKKYRLSKKKSSIIEFNCYVCSDKMVSWTTLVRHFSIDHPSEEVKVLCICGKYLTTMGTVYRHINMHDEKRGYICEHCNKKFPDMKTFEEHVPSHSSEKDFNFVCSQCPRKFYNKRHLRRHEKQHLPPEERLKFSCDICGIRMATKYGIYIHKRARHENIRDHICDVCGRGFATKGNLEGHQTTHMEGNDFKCEKCPKEFKSKVLLQRHQLSHSDDGMKCPLCPTVLKNIRSFRRHKLIHSDVFKFSCTFCGKKFKRSSNLKVHMNGHEGIKPYMCPYCSNPYSTRQNLNLHVSKAHPHAMIGSNFPRFVAGHMDMDRTYSENSVVSEFSE